jgi:hypothetical protein
MEEANRFADGEDAYNNKRGRSPEVDRASRQRRKYRSRDNHTRQSQVAAGYEGKEEEGYENRKFQARGDQRTENRDISDLRLKTCYMDLVESTTRISMERESLTTR